jgi:signal transduction histidine kinase
VDLQEFLGDLKTAYPTPAQSKVKLIWDYPDNLPPLNTDGGMLKQILQNLLNNALKFTEQGSVTLSARHLSGADRVEFTVADTGLGIADEDLATIFERFRQVDSSETRKFGGVGLGLYIVKTFAALLDANVEVESKLGKGTTFRVTLPCKNHDPPHSRSAEVHTSTYLI